MTMGGPFMGFWNSETLKQRLPAEGLIEPYDPDNVEHCAYELTMGEEAFITSTEGKKKVLLNASEPLVIPSGQFALLLTEQKVTIPLDSIGFISMRFSVKKKGLINVSGFHVDPGFKGRLKFAVYNAGSRDVTVSRGDRVFVLWMSKLNEPTEDGYGGEKPEHNTITSDDQNLLHGDIASPAELKREIENVKHFYQNNLWALVVFIGLLSAIAVRVWLIDGAESSPGADEIKIAVKEELRVQLGLHGAERRGDLAEINAAFSLACFQKDFSAIAAFYTDSAQLLHSNDGEALGKPAILAFWRDKLDGSIVAVNVETVQSESSAQNIVETGDYLFAGPENVPVERGKYIVVWKLVNGEWKRHRESWSLLNKSTP
jgi:dCTP deaminase